MQRIPAGEFKAKCLALMDRVAQTGQPLMVTKHGKPVAVVVRAESRDADIFGFLAGKGRVAGDLENTIAPSDWNLPE